MKSRLIAAATILLVAGAFGTRGAAPPGGDETIVDIDHAGDVDHFLAAMVDSGFNGCVLIAKDDQVILHKGYGRADRARAEPVTLATPFWIASISKQFAAAAILKLADQERVSLEDPVTRFFGDVPADKRAITIHQLLTHTAGLQQYYAADGIVDRDAAVRAILERPLARQPGEGFGYSNDAYSLIAAIVEIVSGTPYEVYLRAELLEPAGMMHSGFWGPAEHPEVADILGQAPDSTVARPNWGFRGAVGMYATAGDLHRWYRALDDARVLSASSRRLLFAPHVDRETVDVAYVTNAEERDIDLDTGLRGFRPWCRARDLSAGARGHRRHHELR
ncbi:MAG TPA: serine hydrolase domain-containing protein [Candidatus Krumholzibacteria bacterium]|nr:serine hydrolase domain-containing protein [Candidatus Krumholzibacteria bacterium]